MSFVTMRWRLSSMCTAIILLAMSTKVIAQSCSVNNLPRFRDRGGPSSSHLDIDQLQVIVPSYTFNCHGRVVQWGACVQPGGNPDRDIYELELQVLRPLPVDQNDIQCFSLVGSYSQTGGPNFPPDDIDRCILINIPPDDQIPVQPGDVVGFYYDLLRNDGGSVQLDVFRPDITAFYRERASIPAPNPSSCMLIAGPNNIDSTTTAAPVITVVIETVIPTTVAAAPSPAPPLQFTSLFRPHLPSLVAPSSTPPAVAPSSTPPAVAPSSTPPAVAPSSTPPVVAPSPTPPAVTDDPPIDPLESIVPTLPGDPPVIDPPESIIPTLPGESPTSPNPSPSAILQSVTGGGVSTKAVIGIVIGLLLVIIAVVLVILFALRRKKQKTIVLEQQQGAALESKDPFIMIRNDAYTAVIETESNEAYMTNVDDILSPQNEAGKETFGNDAHSTVITTERNKAYTTYMDVIPAARNMAYGASTELEDGDSINREDMNDYAEVQGQRAHDLSGKENSYAEIQEQTAHGQSGKEYSYESVC